jgi:transaldolase
MQFYIDTADINEIRKANDLGVLDGVTTNPSLIAQAGRKDHDQCIKEICGVVKGPVSAEVLAVEFEPMLKEARHLAALAPNVVVKLPITEAGLKACKKLSEEGIKVNMTLVFSPLQILLCAKAGAFLISPFVGRLDDVSADGMELIQQGVQIIDNYDFESKLLVASVRHPLHVLTAALMGAHVATIPYKVILQLLKHPLTDLGLAKFLEDAKKQGRL